MVSLCCKKIVQAVFDEHNIAYKSIELGEVDLKNPITTEQREQLKIALLKSGHELMADKRAILIERIKTALIFLVRDAEQHPKMKHSDYLVQQLDYDYTYLANLFSEVTGVTVEHFIIAHRIERVKELLLYDELNLTQIAESLNYSSVGHLSSQFKKVTGLTPTYYKKLKHKKRIILEDVGIV
ncbi:MULTISPECIES: helix-turn-helix domain-containing protein [Spirosoma]|nr:MULTISPECIES: AraC family transcriptional regulator [Spirosoma]